MTRAKPPRFFISSDYLGWKVPEAYAEHARAWGDAYADPLPFFWISYRGTGKWHFELESFRRPRPTRNAWPTSIYRLKIGRYKTLETAIQATYRYRRIIEGDGDAVAN